MIRKAFTMTIHPGCEAEYERRHRPIWPELEEALIQHGVQNYSIFLESKTHLLFAYAEIENESRWAEIAKTDVCQKWWHHMKDLMLTHDDNRPVSTPLREVFHMEGSSKNQLPPPSPSAHSLAVFGGDF